jgi:hypothetical protein
VKARREKGTYNALILRRVEEARQVGLIIDITQDDDDSSMNVSPVTMNTNEGSCFCSTATSLQLSASQSTRKKSRRSPRQASIARLDAKRLKVEYEGRYKAAFKDATNRIAAGQTGESVQRMCLRLNKEFNLDGKRQLTRSTLIKPQRMVLQGPVPRKRDRSPRFLQNF